MVGFQANQASFLPWNMEKEGRKLEKKNHLVLREQFWARGKTLSNPYPDRAIDWEYL